MYSLSSDVAMVSPFVDHLMSKINSLRVMDGTEVDIEVALREALLNAIIHGNREDPGKRVYLRVRFRADGEVSMVIRDEGAGFESEFCTRPDYSGAPYVHSRSRHLLDASVDG